MVMCNTCKEESALEYRIDVLDIVVDQLDGMVEAYLNVIAETECCGHEEAQHDFEVSQGNEMVLDHVDLHQDGGEEYDLSVQVQESSVTEPLLGMVRYTIICRVCCSCGEDFDTYLDEKFPARLLV